jgi:tetratricopeptide (TPR) repeat protein
MKPESIVLAVAGAFFGLLVGWVIGTQQAGGSARLTSAAVAAVQPAPAAQAASAAPQAQAPRPLDEAQAQALQAAAAKNPSDATVRVDLGNLYFDAERYPEAVTWYQEALKLAPKDADLSTDLGVAYYYMNEPDRALQQFAESLKSDPKHAKTLLNQGIVLAFGKQDLKGAVASWEKLIRVAPTSPEAATARKALDGLKSAHPGVGGDQSAQPPGK